MSEANKVIATDFIRAFVAADTSALERLVAPDFVDHSARPGQESDRRALFTAAAAFRAGLPDLEAIVQRQVAEGDLVAQGGVMTGTHHADLMGIPATGRQVAFEWMDIYRVGDGLIVECWHVEDVAGLLQQLGGTST